MSPLSTDSEYADGFNFVRRKHRGQVRAGGVPVWHHVARVADILALVLNQTGEGSEEERWTICHAALGHDLLEDTDATLEEVKEIFGERGFELIVGMTDDWDSNSPSLYVDKVMASDEPVQLTKLADLFDNYTSAAHNLHTLGLQWAREYFMPIVGPMADSLAVTPFKEYLETGNRLVTLATTAKWVFEREILRYELGT
jgi:GTP diphosphokinase / guanosine-3',5'-bis(diphosphate) 3'-diphosphatase